MTNAERVQLLIEQSDFLNREAERFKSLAQQALNSGQLNLHPAGVRATADILETISKNVKSVADDMQKDG